MPEARLPQRLYPHSLGLLDRVTGASESVLINPKAPEHWVVLQGGASIWAITPGQPGDRPICGAWLLIKGPAKEAASGIRGQGGRWAFRFWQDQGPRLEPWTPDP
jgi:hypothetical protein